MSTIFDIRNIKLPIMSRAAVTAGTLLVILALVGGYAGWQLYEKLTNTSVVAYFAQTLALYPGDKVQIMGVQVGAIDSIEPAGDKMKVTFHFANKHRVPADATASIINPGLVASRNIQLSPPYTGGPVMRDGAVIPLERTQAPVEYNDFIDSVHRILGELGPTPEQPKGPLGDVIESVADGLEGKGQQLNKTLNGLSDALTVLNRSRGDFFGTVKSLALFVNALHQSDQQFVALNDEIAQLTNSFTNTDQELANAVKDLDDVLAVTRTFLDDNAEVLAHDIDNFADATTAILQQEARDGLETGLHTFPNVAANATNFYSPVGGGPLMAPSALAPITNFANPLQVLCSMVQAGSRLGYQDSAELCAQYLAPILDAVKFNYMPFGMNPMSTAMVLPKMVAYSDPRLRPPPGYKDTTVPGIWARDTLFSHGNHEPGWVVAPGMQGVDVQPLTANMLTPESLAELMGGPDIAPPVAPPAAGVPSGGNLPGPPNAYDERNPLPPPWYPQPGPPPLPAPGVHAADPLGVIAPAAPAAPPLPAEAGAP
ncbi:virulence factor Mce family protein [Mycobacterium sp. IS-3022]|uniref:virulence factor Mce family protein n=1 Tax=Mycobacterium sp. IS-3022 TaxID=1772277 RepID=UPI00074152A2|nr:virulence factor Mce family protein [Mycobacterium sp. IS-3022]KUI01829.1 mammalian cell entry protein [Mycobacterium sp. IS-3022]